MDFPEYGLQGIARPSDFAGEYNSLLFVIRQILGRVNIATLAKVIAVNGGGTGAVGFVDLQPLVNQTDGYGKAIPQGMLHNIPYLRVQGGSNAIILDPEIDDVGIVVFSDRDISLVKATKKQASPSTRRRFDVADALYLGGVLNGVPEQYVQFAAGGITLYSPTKVTIEAPNIQLNGVVNANNSITATGQVTGNGKALSTHVHSGVQTGGGNSGPPV